MLNCRRTFAFFPAILCLLCAVPALHAQEGPPPAAATVQAAVAPDISAQLVRTASVIRATEGQLARIDAYLAELGKKRDALEHNYMARRAKLARTVSALTRLGRTPREAILTRPGGPLQAARTSMLMNASYPVIAAEANSFKALLTDLEKTRSALAKQSQEARTTREQLVESHKTLAALINKRTASAALPSAADARKITDLARAARTLRDFLSTLDTGEASAVPFGSAAPRTPDAVPEGEGILPVSGVVRVAYGQTDAIGAKSSGLKIETLPGSLVVAPLGGVVRYVGPFKGYGNLIIIAHKGGYYSLIAGVDNFSVSEGQTVVSGEPIAILEDSRDANPAPSSMRKTLYYELRLGGQPVNPSRKLPGLV